MGESSKSSNKQERLLMIPRFSHIKDAEDVPFYHFYNRQADPVLKQENRKMQKTEHPLKKPKPKYKKEEKKKPIFVNMPPKKTKASSQKRGMILGKAPPINLPTNMNLERAIKRRQIKQSIEMSFINSYDPDEPPTSSEVYLPIFRPIVTPQQAHIERLKQLKAVKKRHELTPEEASSYLSSVLSYMKKKEE